MLTRRRRDVLECIRPRKTGRAVAHVGLCLIAAIMGLTHTPAVARDFRAADIQAHDYPTVQAIEFMARLITERSGNRHKVTLFHSRQLGEEMETIEQTRIGAIDINRVNIAPLATIAPNLHILGLPFLFRTERPQ